MENNTLTRIAELLTESNFQGKDDEQFFAIGELSPVDIHIEVEEIGAIPFPINQPCIQKLIDISSKSKFGLRDQTILDEKVRNSYEIKADKLHITINQSSFASMLSNMKDGLGVSQNSVLTTHLHNMLIYGPGHFFDMHQDSEKLEHMIASLVIVLPFPHIGGNLVIEHGKQQYVFSSENLDFSHAQTICFYSNCKHKVEMIKHGYRIALTYNVVLEPEEICSVQNESQQLIGAVKDYFDIDLYQSPQNKQPRKLVYFLNHTYTEHGLRLSMLKGEDRINIASFYAVAKKLGLILHLGLVEIRQSWTTDGDDLNPTIDELIDDEITLSYWVDSNNKTVPFDRYSLYEDEICCTKETASFEPDTREYEGYMGNYGNTMDYWYRRAAIVLWPQSSQIPINFMLNYDNAINDLNALTHAPGNEQKVLETIEKAGEYLYKTSSKKEKDDFSRLADIALYIKDKDKALSILSHFQWSILNFDIAKLLIKLQTQYGIGWCINLLDNWKSKERYHKACLIQGIYSFVQTFLPDGGSYSIVELLLEVQSNALMDKDKKDYVFQKPVELKKSLPKRISILYQTLAACGTTQEISVLDKIIEHLISNPSLYPDTSLVELFLKLQDTVASEYLVHYKLLNHYLVNTISSQLALGMRAVDDWSIDVTLPCSCSHCMIATSFLHSKTEMTKIWPIIAAVRDHITDVFNGLDLPVNLSVKKVGSPHKLMMVKTEQLHIDSKKRFDALEFYQKKLQSSNSDKTPNI